MAYVLGGECRGAGMYRATRLRAVLALPGALPSPAHPSDTLCCGVRNIPLPAGSNAVISLTHRTCEHNNFSSRLSLSRPPEGL